MDSRIRQNARGKNYKKATSISYSIIISERSSTNFSNMMPEEILSFILEKNHFSC
jgi:hypothetical protein